MKKSRSFSQRYAQSDIDSSTRAYAHQRTREQGACASALVLSTRMIFRARSVFQPPCPLKCYRSLVSIIVQGYKGLYGSFFLMRSLFSCSIVPRRAVARIRTMEGLFVKILFLFSYHSNFSYSSRVIPDSKRYNTKA